MQYNGAQLGNLFISYSSSKSELTSGGALTPSYTSMCLALGKAISQCHNIFQSTALVNNIIVNGGMCTVNGPLIAGIGNGGPGSVVGNISNVGSTCISEFPTSQMNDLTPALRSYIRSIGQGFETVFNNFITTSVVTGIIVNAGICTCQIIAGVPVPGTYFGGIGILAPLSSGVVGSPVNSSILYSTMLSLMDSNVLAQGIPTPSLAASLSSICDALQEYHTLWMNSSMISNLSVNGGITIPNGPITAGIGMAGSIV
jgi:hypothetical protein